MVTPICPTHKIPMKLMKVTQGDTFLGQFFSCPKYEVYGVPENECIGAIDADAEGNPVYESPIQLGLFDALDSGLPEFGARAHERGGDGEQADGDAD